MNQSAVRLKKKPSAIKNLAKNKNAKLKKNYSKRKLPRLLHLKHRFPQLTSRRKNNLTNAVVSAHVAASDQLLQQAVVAVIKAKVVVES